MFIECSRPNRKKKKKEKVKGKLPCNWKVVANPSGKLSRDYTIIFKSRDKRWS